MTSIVIDHATGEVLLSDDADSVNYPASLTKMMTLYLLFEAMQDGRVKLTDTITFSAGLNKYQLPVEAVTKDGNAVLVLADGAEPILDYFRGIGPPPPVAPVTTD